MLCEYTASVSQVRVKREYADTIACSHTHAGITVPVKNAELSKFVRDRQKNT